MSRLFLLLIFVLTLLTTFNVFNVRSSADIFSPCNLAPDSAVCKDINKSHPVDPIVVVIKAAIEVIAYLTGVAAVILIIVSGIKFVTSGGNPQAVASARSTLIYALVGLFITIISVSIVTFIIDKI